LLHDQAEENLEQNLSEDFDALEKYIDEYQDEDTDAFSDDVPPKTKEEILREKELLECIKKLADTITSSARDAKAEELLAALQIGFQQVETNKGFTKACHFAEENHHGKILHQLRRATGGRREILYHLRGAKRRRPAAARARSSGTGAAAALCPAARDCQKENQAAGPYRGSCRAGGGAGCRHCPLGPQGRPRARRAQQAQPVRRRNGLGQARP
jgi:hypothetical protein